MAQDYLVNDDWVGQVFELEKSLGLGPIQDLMEDPVFRLTDEQKKSILQNGRMFLSGQFELKPSASHFCQSIVDNFSDIWVFNPKKNLKDPWFIGPILFTILGFGVGYAMSSNIAFLSLLLPCLSLQWISYEIGKSNRSRKYLSDCSKAISKYYADRQKNPPQCHVCGEKATLRCTICEKLNPTQKSVFLCGPECQEIHSWTLCGKNDPSPFVGEA